MQEHFPEGKEMSFHILKGPWHAQEHECRGRKGWVHITEQNTSVKEYVNRRPHSKDRESEWQKIFKHWKPEYNQSMTLKWSGNYFQIIQEFYSEPNWESRIKNSQTCKVSSYVIIHAPFCSKQWKMCFSSRKTMTLAPE